MKILKSMIVLITFLVTVVFLVSCEEKNNDVFITKYYENGTFTKNMIELHNPTDKEIELTDYSLVIYKDGLDLEKRTIHLGGSKISPKGFLLVASTDLLFKENDEIFKDKNKVIKEELKYNGNDPIAIVKKDNILDTVGEIGATYDFGINTTLVRNKDINYGTKKFDITKFIEFVPYYYDSLSKIDENADLKIVEKGPRFNPEYLKTDFFVEEEGNRIGTSGAIKVNLVAKVDGDTTNFSIHESSLISETNKKLLKAGKYNDGVMRTRYYFVNTPESTKQGGIQEFGKWATLLTGELLDRAVKADSLYIQSIDNEQILEGYQRELALVWADGYLINWLLVRDSLSPYRQSPREKKEGVGTKIHHKNILIRYYLKYAEYLAIKDNIRIHNVNDKDAMLNYKAEGNEFKQNYEKYFVPTYKKYLFYDEDKK